MSSGVFRLAGVPSTWHQLLMITVLAWGAGAVVSHRAAAALWRLAGFEPGIVEVTVPRRRSRAGPGIVHRHRLGMPDATTFKGIPVTTPARTLLDIAGVSPSDTVEEALDDALRRALVSIPRLRWRLDEVGGRGRPGVTALRALLDARDPAAAVPESVFERRLLRVLVRAGFPEPVAQHRIRSGGRTIAVADFAYPDARLAIEADGYRWHSSRSRWERDLERRNALALVGWRVVNVSWTELTTRPDAVVNTIRKALAAGASELRGVT